MIIKKNLVVKILISFLAVMLPASVCGQTNIQKSEKEYTLGVVPQLDSLKLRKIWKPVLKELTELTGIRFKMLGSSTIPAFEREFNSGVFDFAYMNPYHILVASENQGYIPLVNDKGRTLHGVLVVKKDSPIQSPGDLMGKVVALPAPNALGASLMIRAAFKDEFHINVQPKYVQTHTSVYLNVVLAEADAGGGVQKTLALQSSDIKDNLRVIYETEKVTPHPFTAHRRVPENVREKIINAFLEMGRNSKGKALLEKIPIKMVGQATLEDYYPLKELKLERFYVKE